MKYSFRFLLSFLLTAFIAVSAWADASYSYTNPTYIPTAISAPASLSAPGTYTMTLHGITATSLRVTGTCTSLAGTVQGTNDGTNWTNITMYPVGGGASTQAISSTGFWRMDTAGFSKVRANVTALTASCTFAMAGTQGPAFRQATDPCQDPAILKSSVAVNQSASTTAALVSASTGKSVYVCSFAASAVGTNPTMTVKYGTQVTTPCDTGPANLTGAIIPAAADGMVNLGMGHTVAVVPASNQLCLTTGATTSIQGVMTYVQQ